MDQRMYREVVNQLSRLISDRKYLIKQFNFVTGSHNTLYIQKNGRHVCTANMNDYTLQDVISQTSRWKKYKTYILNKALDTNRVSTRPSTGRPSLKRPLSTRSKVLYAYPVKGVPHFHIADDSSGE